MISRRSFIAGLAAAPGAATIATWARADLALGQATLTTVSDGHLTLPGNMVFAPMPQAELLPILDRYGVSAEQVTPDCNLALYRDGTNTVLFDVGAGPDFMPTAGALVDSLDAIGLAPEDVTHVLFTHGHPDHIWGLLDEFDDPLFYDATYLMGRAEWDYWWNPETVNTIGEARQAFAVGAKRRLEAIEDQVTFFDDGEEVLPGILATASYGHTPGHMAFEVGTGTDTALVIGDAIVNHHVAFARPDWPIGADQDQDMGAATRKALLARLASSQMPVVGFHLPEGGIGRVETAEEGYRYVPG